MATESACRVAATDPICGASFDQEKATASYDFQGFTYHFCSSRCRDKFVEVTIAGFFNLSF
jgi:YHS domain-containing protein